MGAIKKARKANRVARLEEALRIGADMHTTLVKVVREYAKGSNWCASGENILWLLNKDPQKMAIEALKKWGL